MSLHPRHSIEEDGAVAVAPRRQTRQPRRFGVVLHNDDYTTMEFVVLVLVRFFGKSEEEATNIMFQVHHRGRGIAGIYIRDVAESKADLVEEFARAEGHPLRCTTEPFDSSDESRSSGDRAQ
jgi:ATP-dependent Clp protease adaptor protein ClpS